MMNDAAARKGEGRMTTTPTTSATRVDEIADGVYRISTPLDAVPGGFTFNQFLIDDDEPLLFHTLVWSDADALAVRTSARAMLRMRVPARKHLGSG